MLGEYGRLPSDPRYVPADGKPRGAYGDTSAASLLAADELRENGLRWAVSSGRAYGRRWGGDSWAFARAQGVVVKTIPQAAIVAAARAPVGRNEFVAGMLHRGSEERWRNDPDVAYVDSSLPKSGFRGQAATLAHELAHVQHPTWSDELCEEFAAAFIAEGPFR